MSLEFTEKNLNEIYDFSSGLSKSADEFGFGFPFLSFKTIFNNYYIDSDLDELVNSTNQEQKRHSIKKGDVFLTRTSETLDELGMSCVALKDYPNATYNGFTKRLRPKEDNVIHPLYAAYYFRSSIFRKYVDSMAVMTTRASLNNDILSHLPIFYPSYENQEKIGKLLHDLSKKIELNNQINHYLEKLILHIFDEYILKFSISNHECMVESELGSIPSSWSVKTIGDYAKVKSGFAFKSAWWQSNGVKVIKIKDISSGTLDIENCDCVDISKTFDAKEFEVNKGDFLIAMTGSIGSFAIVPKFDDPLFVNQRVGKFFLGEEPLKKLPFLWSSINQKRVIFELINKAHGSVQPNIGNADIESIPILMPPDEIIEMFNHKCKKYFELHSNNQYESMKLIKLRDTLLPKLMSGEIDVSKIN